MCFMSEECWPCGTINLRIDLISLKFDSCSFTVLTFVHRIHEFLSKLEQSDRLAVFDYLGCYFPNGKDGLIKHMKRLDDLTLHCDQLKLPIAKLKEGSLMRIFNHFYELYFLIIILFLIKNSDFWYYLNWVLTARNSILPELFVVLDYVMDYAAYFLWK